MGNRAACEWLVVPDDAGFLALLGRKRGDNSSPCAWLGLDYYGAPGEFHTLSDQRQSEVMFRIDRVHIEPRPCVLHNQSEGRITL